jgi:hypothetical protein
MPKEMKTDSSGALVKLRMPSKVVYPDASDRAMPVEASSVSCQLSVSAFSMPCRMRLLLNSTSSARAARMNG